uniref:Uncharacterized protein n=1 Tax=Oryzias latipes TaxID=8090 RepID=A0A3P9LA10_ORYLA
MARWLAARAWAWAWGHSRDTTTQSPKRPSSGGWGLGGWPSWMWGKWRPPIAHCEAAEEFWEAEEKLPPATVEDVGVEKPESSAQTSKWWSSYLPSFSFWPRNNETDGLKKGKKKRAAAQQETDGDFSDYETPPPSPLPISLSPFRLFAHSLTVEILAEHYEICFNFLRHLFDLCVVAFLWTVSPPAKLVLEVLGVQGALKLWLHGMALFFVSTVGMAGLLWLIQEYLPQFALIYGIIQALVISVSIRQSVILEVDEDNKEEEERDEEIEGLVGGEQGKGLEAYQAGRDGIVQVSCRRTTNQQRLKQLHHLDETIQR